MVRGFRGSGFRGSGFWFLGFGVSHSRFMVSRSGFEVIGVHDFRVLALGVGGVRGFALEVSRSGFVVFGVWGFAFGASRPGFLGSRVSGLEFGVRGLEFGVSHSRLGFLVRGSGFSRFRGSEFSKFRVSGSGFSWF